MNDQQILVERENNRRLLIIYDLVLYYIIALSFYIVHHGVADFNFSAYNIGRFLVCPILLIISRLIFRIYKRIWRNPGVGAFARLILSEVLAGIVYVSYAHVMRFAMNANIPGLFDTILFLAVDLVAVSSFRILYVYFFQFASSDKKGAKTVKRIIERFGLVDFSANETGGILKIVLEPESYHPEPINDVLAVFYRFEVKGRVVNVKQNNSGYINKTYRIDTITENGHKHSYILQRINTRVFTDPEALMKNYTFVVDHLKDKFTLPGMNSKGAIAMVKNTRDGKSYLEDIDGCWRIMTCFDDVHSLDVPDSTDTFYNAGKAFGQFIYNMSDVESDEIINVIPNFHNTQSRYEDLLKAIELDPVGRVKEVAKEIEFVKEHDYLYNIIAKRRSEGVIPTRICHNDTNLNNILFDNKTNHPVAIIDLDTVMPSTPLYDFGDSMRIGTNTAKDDEKDLRKVSCNMDMYKAYARGWLEACGKMLTKEELSLLPYASLVITSEDGIRFLMDHINGDVYYNIYYPRQNLDRSRTQLALLADMEKKLPEIKSILKEIYEDLGLNGDPFAYDFKNNRG